MKTDRVHLVLINQGVNTELPASRQFLPLIVAFAQLERERTSERVKGIITYIRAAGGTSERCRSGYMTVTEGRLKKLVKHPENYAWLEKMAEWYRAGVCFRYRTAIERTRCQAPPKRQGPRPVYMICWTKRVFTSGASSVAIRFTTETALHELGMHSS